MTREEAIRTLERADNYVGIHYVDGVEDTYINPHLKEAIQVSLTALCGPTREMVERMRGEWKKDVPLGYMCKSCGGLVVEQTNFCPNCGQPKTDEAVDMMLERLKEAMDNG